MKKFIIIIFALTTFAIKGMVEKENQNGLQLNFVISTADYSEIAPKPPHIINAEEEQHAMRKKLKLAIAQKTPHIFISYALWSQHLKTRQSQLDKFKKAGIEDPQSQIIIRHFPRSQRVFPVFLTDGKETEKAKRVREEEIKNFEKNSENTGAAFLNLVTKEETGISTHLGQRIKSLLFNEADWNMFDTQDGLYYLQAKSSDITVVQLNNCAPIEHPLRESQKIDSHNWVKNLSNILDPRLAGHHLKIALYGHGSIEKHGILAGLNRHQSKMFLNFFNNELPAETMKISTCYGYPERIKNLIGGAHNFKLITAVDTHKEAVQKSGFDIHTYDANQATQIKLQK